MELNGFSLQFIKTVFNFILLLLLFLAQSLSIHFDLEKSPWAVPHALGPTTCPGLYHMPWAQFADNERTAVFSAPSGLPTICQKKRHSQSSMFLFFFSVPPISSPKAHAAVYKMPLFRSPLQEAKGNLRLLSDNVL